MSDQTTITVDLTTAEAMAFAQFLKRVGWCEYRANSVDDAETYLMRDAGNKIRSALADVGYAPR